jgi:hypothetical protein
VNADFTLHKTNEVFKIRTGGNDTRNRPAALRDHESVRMRMIEERKTLFLELRRVNLLHAGLTISCTPLSLVQSVVRVGQVADLPCLPNQHWAGNDPPADLSLQTGRTLDVFRREGETTMPVE